MISNLLFRKSVTLYSTIWHRGLFREISQSEWNIVLLLIKNFPLHFCLKLFQIADRRSYSMDWTKTKFWAWFDWLEHGQLDLLEFLHSPISIGFRTQTGSIFSLYDFHNISWEATGRFPECCYLFLTPVTFKVWWTRNLDHFKVLLWIAWENRLLYWSVSSLSRYVSFLRHDLWYAIIIEVFGLSDGFFCSLVRCKA